MAEIVNLNRARKDRRRAEDKAAAAANRVAHGLTKGQRDTARLERERASRLLDGSKRDSDTPED